MQKQAAKLSDAEFHKSLKLEGIEDRRTSFVLAAKVTNFCYNVTKISIGSK
jgi:hypothetical protein